MIAVVSYLLARLVRNTFTMHLSLFFILLVSPCFGARLGAPEPDSSNNYIINGGDEKIENFPHQGSLQYIPGRHTCGCSLISEMYAVTAAHCVGGQAKAYVIRFGSSDRNSGGKLYYVKGITRHPNYIESGMAYFPNDIAVLHIDGPVDVSTKYIKPIRLAEPFMDNFVGSSCSITGWGLTTEGDSSNAVLPDTLQGININVLSMYQCQMYFEGVSYDKHICLGARSGPGACSGDSGGPLTCNTLDTKVLAGVASFVANGCWTSYPSAYVRVSSYREWIRQVSGV